MSPEVQAQVTSALRIAVPLALTWLVARGWLSADSVGPLTSQVIDLVIALIGVGAIVWGIITNSKRALIKKVADMSDVKKVVAVAAVSEEGNLADHPKVVSR